MRRPRESVVLLTHNWRFGGAIAELATAVRLGDTAAVERILDDQPPGVQWRETADEDLAAEVRAVGRRLRTAARAGDAAKALEHLEEHRLLCAHRTGPAGVARWERQVEIWLAADRDGPELGPWYPGRPLLITANDYALGLFNGDTGVVVADEGHGVVAVFPRPDELVRFPPTRLGALETVHAMTVHRSQGSQFAAITLVLPEPASPLLTRQLLYTAITRARERVRLVGPRASILRAVQRQAARASGLRDRISAG